MLKEVHVTIQIAFIRHHYLIYFCVVNTRLECMSHFTHLFTQIRL